MTYHQMRPEGGIEQTISYREQARGTALYRLKFDYEGGRPAKDVECEAEDAAQALIIAHREARKHSAELWRNGKKLCSIRRQSNEVWEIVSAEERLLVS